MPNWCSNTLQVNGNLEDLRKFIEDASGDSLTPTLSFNALVPLPEEEKGDWYNWRISNWGTKWDVDHDADMQGSPEEGELLYYFSSAWSPPIEWLITVAPRYEKLSFDLIYEESGVSFAGRLAYSNGQCVEDVIYAYQDEGYREFCEEHFGSDYFWWEEEDDEDQTIY